MTKYIWQIVFFVACLTLAIAQVNFIRLTALRYNYSRENWTIWTGTSGQTLTTVNGDMKDINAKSNNSSDQLILAMSVFL